MLCVDIVYNVISVNNVLLCYVLIFFTMSFLLQCVVMLCVDILYNVISVNNVLLCYVLIFFTLYLL